MNKFMEALANMFRVPDLRNRIMFTLGMLAIYRLGAFIPTPGINRDALQSFFQQNSGTLFGFINLFSGGMFESMTIFALGIMPYITSSIILQLLTVVWPYLEKLSKEGELGRRKITQYTRYGTVVLSVIQGMGISFFLERTTAPGGAPLVPEDLQGWGFRLMTVLTLTTGTAFVMWLGEQITERGIGNGMSLIIFAGIVAGLPRAVAGTLELVNTGQLSIPAMLIILALVLAVIYFIVRVERGQRRISTRPRTGRQLRC